MRLDYSDYCLITPEMIQREFLRLIGETDGTLVSVTVRSDGPDMAADVEVRGQSFTIEFEVQVLAGTLDDFSDHYVAPAIETLNLK